MTDSLLEPEFENHFKAWKKEPSPRTSDAILTAVKPVIDSAMRSYAGKSPSPTLRSKAKLLTLDALGRYEPAKAKLRTHLMVNLQGLRRAAAQEGQIISIPERVALDQYRLFESENELKDKLGRDPSDMELADHTGLSRKRISHVRMAKPGFSEGSMMGMSEEGEPQSFAPGVVPTGDNSAWHEFVYLDMNPIDQLIMEHSLGMHGKKVLPKQEIARKLRLSPGAVSQRAARIQAKLDQREELATGLF